MQREELFPPAGTHKPIEIFELYYGIPQEHLDGLGIPATAKVEHKPWSVRYSCICGGYYDRPDGSPMASDNNFPEEPQYLHFYCQVAIALAHQDGSIWAVRRGAQHEETFEI